MIFPMLSIDIFSVSEDHVYLSDMQEALSSVGWGSFMKDIGLNNNGLLGDAVSPEALVI